jgi:HSP20 family molecular chaperone IbpA
MLIHLEVPAFAHDVFETSNVRTVEAPNTDVYEGENETVVVMEMPGVEKSAVNVAFDRSVLTVSAERKSSDVPSKGRLLMQERSVGAYRRSVRIHHPVDIGAMTALLADGVLKVTVPKAEIAKPRVIEVR